MALHAGTCKLARIVKFKCNAEWWPSAAERMLTGPRSRQWAWQWGAFLKDPSQATMRSMASGRAARCQRSSSGSFLARWLTRLLLLAANKRSAAAADRLVLPPGQARSACTGCQFQHRPPVYCAQGTGVDVVMHGRQSVLQAALVHAITSTPADHPRPWTSRMLPRPGLTCRAWPQKSSLGRGSARAWLLSQQAHSATFRLAPPPGTGLLLVSTLQDAAACRQFCLIAVLSQSYCGLFCAAAWYSWQQNV